LGREILTKGMRKNFTGCHNGIKKRKSESANMGFLGMPVPNPLIGMIKKIEPKPTIHSPFYNV
jgi:hypothetical protein